MERYNYLTLPPLEEFEKLVSCANYLIEENVKRQEIVDPKRIYQHEIFVKYVFHINSLLSIFNGTNIYINSKYVKYLDYPSIITLIRASLETFLTYYYIFIDPKNDDENIFRYNNWFIDGLNKRQKMEVGFDENLKKVQMSEKLNIEECIKIIKSTDAYKRLSQKEKDRIDKDKMFKRPGWSEIFRLTGVSEYWAKTFYSYFSSYAHSTSSCIIQLNTARTDKSSGKILMMCIHFSLIITSMFIDRYCKDFNVGERMENEKKKSIEAWIWLGKNLSKPKI